MLRPLLNLSVNEIKSELKKTPKFLRTIRSNKAPMILDESYGMKAEPYNAMDKELIYKRAKLVRENEKFSQNVITALKRNCRRKRTI